MGRIATPSSLSQEIQSIYSAGGFDAGDYVYYNASARSFGKLPTTSEAATVTTMQALTSVTGGGFSATTPAGQNGPTQFLATYTGTTFAADTVKIADAALGITCGGVAIESLLGGNYVVLWCNNSGTLAFNRYTAAGVAIGGSVTVSTNFTANSANAMALTATQDGGFVVAFRDSGSYQNLQRYDASGVAVGYLVTITSFPGSSSLQVKSLSDGRIILAWSNSGSYGYFQVRSADLATVLAGPNYIDSGACSNPNPYIGLAPLLDGGFVFTWYDYNAGGGYRKRFNATYGGTASGVSYVWGTGVSSCALDDGGWVHVSISSQQLYVVRFNASGTQVSVTNPPGPFGGVAEWYETSGVFHIMPQPNSRMMILATTYSGNVYKYCTVRQIGGSASSPTWGPATQVNPLNAGTFAQRAIGNVIAQQLDGSLLFAYSLSNAAYALGRYTRGLTNGVEYAGVSFTPTTYTLIGVALTDAPAGGSGKVLTKGLANLNSSYRNVTTTMAFDYAQFSGIAGNRGTAIGRTVTLKGLA